MASQNIERIIEAVRQLPLEERRQLREALDLESQSVTSPPSFSQQGEHRQREQQWIAEHRNEYLGEWVVVEGNNLIVHGHDARTVYEAARAAGVEIPFLIHVEPSAEPAMGGW